MGRVSAQKEVELIKYLGSISSKKGVISCGCESGLVGSLKTFGTMNKISLVRNVSSYVKRVLYERVLMLAVTQGTEMLSSNERVRRKHDVMWNNYLRRMHAPSDQKQYSENLRSAVQNWCEKKDKY